MVNSRTKHNCDKVIKFKKPSIKRMRLTGKTVYDKYTNVVGQTVWVKKYENMDGRRVLIYVLGKCDKEDCNGILKYDTRGFKCCNICGLGTKVNDVLLSDLKYGRSLYDNPITPFNKFNGNTKFPDETIKTRNVSNDKLKIDDFIYYNDKGADKIIRLCENIRNWENENEVRRGKEL